MFDQLGDEETSKAGHLCHVKFKLVLLFSCFPFRLLQEGIKCCRGNREDPARAWLAHDTQGLGKVRVGDKDSNLPECVPCFRRGGTCRILKQRWSEVPINASEVSFGGVLCLFLFEFCSPSPTELDSHAALIRHSVALGLHHCNTSDLNSFSLA